MPVNSWCSEHSKEQNEKKKSVSSLLVHQMKSFQVNLIDSVPLQTIYMLFLFLLLSLSLSAFDPFCKLGLCIIFFTIKISRLAFVSCFRWKIETSSLIIGHMVRSERKFQVITLYVCICLWVFIFCIYLKSKKKPKPHCHKNLHFRQLLAWFHDCNKYMIIV